MVRWYSHCVNSLVVPQKLNIFITKRSENKASNIYLDTNTHSSMIRSSQKVAATDDWINEMQYIPTMEYFSAIKTKYWYMLQKWMNPENTMPSEMNQMQKDKLMTPVVWNIYNRQRHRGKKEIRSYQWLGRW